MQKSQEDPVIAERYAVGELLGRGGMAEVHAGTDRRLDRPVAIKRLRPEMAARHDVRTRFEAEARLAAGLAHPNAVAVYDTGEHLGNPYIVMERLPGETLADRMCSGPVDPEWLRTLVLEVLGALAAAHATDIVHRDVKPANVLIAADGRAKLADFGIAKSLWPADGIGGAPDPTATGAWVGTGDSPVAEAHAIVRGDHSPLGRVRPDLDPALVEIVERAMATEPGSRFASAAEMANAFMGQPDDVETLSGNIAPGMTHQEHTQVLEQPSPVPGPRWRSPRLLAGAAAVLAAIVAIALAGAADPSPPRTADANPPATSVVPSVPPLVEQPSTPAAGATTPEVVTPHEPIRTARAKARAEEGRRGSRTTTD